MPRPRPKPTKADLAAAHNSVTVPDLIGPGLDILFVGINPGLYSGATGHHFARPGNRFWPALHRSGLTPRLLSPFEERELLALKIGISKLVDRATATAAELEDEEYRKGAAKIRRQVRRYGPRAVAFLGVGAYCAGFGHQRARIGPADDPLEGSELWVFPNPSGLNANYQLPDFVRLFKGLRRSLQTR